MSTTKPLYDAPRVGGDVLSFCSKCKMELAHVVVAMVGKTPIKVQCKTCKGTHGYRKVGGASTGRSTSTRSAGAAKPKLPAKSSARWEERLSQTHGKDPVPYDARKAFAQGDVVNHPNFGVGVIEEVKLNGKILVLFREGEKVLIHARSG
jgi:hypothetical protein